ncbi:hypothetical protein BDQ17DRAFT_1434572 [Cyathus striatus]|nr:hypothetical protein BDQ17DRAFT_1434572 [Cyathus striatus]
MLSCIAFKWKHEFKSMCAATGPWRENENGRVWRGRSVRVHLGLCLLIHLLHDPVAFSSILIRIITGTILVHIISSTVAISSISSANIVNDSENTYKIVLHHDPISGPSCAFEMNNTCRGT